MGSTSGLASSAANASEQACNRFQAGLADEVDHTARAIYEELEKSPVGWPRCAAASSPSTWQPSRASLVIGRPRLARLVLVPLAASVTHQLVEWLGPAYVDTQREQTRNRQQALVAKHVADPLAEWLAHWPATGGTAYERLQLALSRVPRSHARTSTRRSRRQAPARRSAA